MNLTLNLNRSIRFVTASQIRYGLFAGAFVLLGILLRLDQWSAQLLADDEWHALLWVSQFSALKTFLSFGVSDHSIPMALYDILVSHFTPLNEAWMRGPILLAGILMLVFASVWLIRNRHPIEAVTIVAFMAVSPLLVYFSRLARPYAPSLLLAYVAHWAFWQYWHTPRLKWLMLYALTGALATWLLSLAGFFVIAPILYVVPQLFRMASARRAWIKVLRLGTAFGLAAGIVLLPPLLVSLDDLAAKAGQNSPGLDTWINVWFTWFGTHSVTLVVAMLLLMILGAQAMLRQFELSRSALLGCGLVLSAIYLARPAQSFHAVTFGRYLIFALPLIMLSIACGVTRLIELLRLPRWTAVGLVGMIAGATFATSHLPDQLRPNNAYTLNAYYYMDPRSEKNPTLRTMGFPISAFWSQLKSQAGPLRIGVAPYYFESYYWPVVRWHQLSGQVIVPLFVNGFCMPDHHPGEPPFIARKQIKLANGVYLAEANIKVNLFKMHGLDWIVWQKPRSRPVVPYQPDFSRCDIAVPEALGKPEYEDDYLMAFRVK